LFDFASSCVLPQYIWTRFTTQRLEEVNVVCMQTSFSLIIDCVRCNIVKVRTDVEVISLSCQRLINLQNTDYERAWQHKSQSNLISLTHAVV
jgi:hypothetical protein